MVAAAAAARGGGGGFFLLLFVFVIKHGVGTTVKRQGLLGSLVSVGGRRVHEHDGSLAGVLFCSYFCYQFPLYVDVEEESILIKEVF